MTSILITVGALGLMYVCCIRPMRRGCGAAARSCCSAANANAHGSSAVAQLSRDAAASVPARVSNPS